MRSCLNADIVIHPGAQSVETIVEELVVYLEADEHV